MIIRKILFRLILLSAVIGGCTKTSPVRFHGRVTFECTGESVTNKVVKIYRNYETGIHNRSYIGECLTDANGYYTLFAEVRNEGEFVSYRLHGDPSLENNTREITDGFGKEVWEEQNDIEVDMTASLKKIYAFYISNTSPVNVNDNILITNNYTFFHLPIADLSGMTVDTVIYYYYPNSNLEFTKKITKNQISTSVTDSVRYVGSCLDTTSVSIQF